MIIQCPNCSARYAVPDRSIGADGRNVRCAKCQNNWFVSLPPGSEKPVPALESAAETQPVAKLMPKGSNLPAVKPPQVSAAMQAAVGCLAAVAAALMVLAVWPSVYGYPPSQGLALAEVNMFSRFDEKNLAEKRPIYEISGKIINQAEETREVPILRISLLDKSGTKLQYWDFSEAGKTLEAGKNLPFSTGPLDIKFKQPAKFMVELGNALELSLRKQP